MSHHRKSPESAPAALPDAPVLVVCRDPHHHGTEEWGQLGYHLVGTLRPVDGRLEWTGHAPERGPARTSGIKIAVDMPAGSPPVKRYRRDDGRPTWRFRCRCGLDKQRSEPDLAAIVGAWTAAFPGRPVEVDLCRL